MSVCVVLWYTYAVPAVDVNANKTALVSYKAEVRAKSMAVSKAEIVLNEVCAAMASRLGRVDGVTISPNKGRILLEVRADTVRVHFFLVPESLLRTVRSKMRKRGAVFSMRAIRKWILILLTLRRQLKSCFFHHHP